MSESNLVPVIRVEHLFREIGSHLIRLLRSLSPDEWHRPTSSSRRVVKDVASHLLDGSLRRLSMQRDGYFSHDDSGRMRPDETLMEFLNRLNSDWDTATRRLSPTVLTELMEWADFQLADLFESLDPFGEAIFAVAWAGETQSQNWLDVARDYTEKWHHTQQIFEATGRISTITNRQLFHPCLETFLRALPHTFRDVESPDGTTVALRVSGDAGGVWYLERASSGWRQILKPVSGVSSTVVIEQLNVWRLVTKRRTREQVHAQFPDIQIEGDNRLGEKVLEMVSMMA